MIGYLVEHCAQWWQRHIVEGFPPEADGLQATKDLLGKLWSVKTEEVAEVPLDRARSLRQQRAELQAEAKRIDTDLTAVENAMRLLTGEAEFARVGNKNAWSWKQNGNFAPKRFRDENPELAEKYTRMVEAIDTERLAADHPLTYASYRARVLRVPAKEL